MFLEFSHFAQETQAQSPSDLPFPTGRHRSRAPPWVRPKFRLRLVALCIACLTAYEAQDQRPREWNGLASHDIDGKPEG